MFRNAILALSALLLLTGCVVVDVSMTESALPPDRKGMEFSPYYSAGGLISADYLDLVLDDKNRPKQSNFWNAPIYFGISSRLSVLATDAVSDRGEITAKAWLSSTLNLGAKLGYKQVLWQSSGPAVSGEAPVQSCLAVQPSLNALILLWVDEEEVVEGEKRPLLAGADCLLMYSRYRDVSSVTTFGLRLGWQREWGDLSGHYVVIGNTPYLSLAANKSLPISGGFGLVPGIGVTLQPAGSYWPLLLPFFNLGLTLP